MDITLKTFDRKTRKAGDTITPPDKREIKLIRQRFYRDANGNKVEGCVIEMRNDHKPQQYNLANTAAEARRATGFITTTPAGSNPVQTN